MMLSTIIIVCLGLSVYGLPVDNNDRQFLKDVNPELLGGGFEGDMILPSDFNLSRGAAIYGARRRWPNRIIPYDISAITDANDRTTIKNAMNKLMFDVGTSVPGQIARQTCVVFRPAQTDDKEILKIQYGNGCSATIGYGENYEKTLNLQPRGCFHSGIIQHELNHVLGFFHEQSRPDRDSYITIHQANIIPNQEHNFKKYAWGSDLQSQGFSYDYSSLMHYGPGSFSVNGKPTITPINSNVVIGQREKLSETDIAEIRQYYSC
ncbi:unnamed protein product [Rotaria sp. Silwood2]|nr:unnamed protein product [Rotaria sp. Silwood2]CAF2863095.1 unnamed protein product [Rotaria sp. Silwood2]CAF3892194.1 unnamed protein product [Rotaria sp. Silwood2]CAF3904279.1 unnamed protein product [Rotaria sp. Silwood2]